MRELGKVPGNDNYTEADLPARPEPWHPGDGESEPGNENVLPLALLPGIRIEPIKVNSN